MSMIEQEPTTLSPLGKFVAAVKGHERWLLAFGIALQLVVLLFMTVKGTLILLYGDVYYVRVVPVDPRDMMRGRYVILSYDFSRPPHHMFGGNFDGRQVHDRPIYVSLAREGDGKHWRGVNHSFERPRQGPFLKGKMGQRGLVEFENIQQFFTQEDKAPMYEAAAQSRQLSAEIAVTPEGEAAMRGLHILGK